MTYLILFILFRLIDTSLYNPIRASNNQFPKQPSHMAHRLQFTKDITLPKPLQDYRQHLQKQIQKLRQRQQLFIQQNDQKLLLLQKRLIYGKKKIFAFDKQVNRMTLNGQIAHYNMEIQRLKDQIGKEQRVVKEKREEEKEQNERMLTNKIVGETVGMRRESMQFLEAPLTLTRKKTMAAMANTYTSTTDPQQQLLLLTHQAIRLKKSLQQVRSKYSDNFTQYKLKQQYQKLQQQNEQIAQQLKHLQTHKSSLHQAIATSSLSDVDYDQLEVIQYKNEYLGAKKQRDLLMGYLQKMEREVEERRQTDEGRQRMFREDRIEKLLGEVNQVRKANQILVGEVRLTEGEIGRVKIYQMQLMGRAV